MGKKEARIKSKKRFRSSITGRLVIGLVAIICLAGAILVGVSGVYAGKGYPRVIVGGINVGGMTKDKIIKALEPSFKTGEDAGLTFTHEGREWKVKAENLELQYDEEKTAEAVIAVGQINSYPKRLWRLMKAISRQEKIKPIYTYNQSKVDEVINAIGQELNTPEVDATGEIINNEVKIISEKNGMTIDMEQLRTVIDKALVDFSRHIVKVAVAEVKPKVTTKETSRAVKEAETMLEAKITLTYKDNSWSVRQKRIGEWIDFQPIGITESGKEVTAYEEGVGIMKYRLKAMLNEKKMDKYLQKIAEGIDSPAKNAKVRIINDKPVLRGKGENGYEIDRDQAIKEMTPVVEAGGEESISMTARTVKPEVSEENIDEIGIKEKIGSGRTLFYGSSAVRIHNIRNGVRILNGQLIRPGEVFSVGDALGEVSAETGYLPGLVIKENRTTPEYGGGLCQVSTTLFRAALDSGLKILERQNHSYRVSFYETDGNGKFIGPGLDSTVYFPHPDLKFLNDTGHYILVTGEVVGASARFTFWGTDDGRKTEIDGPHLLKTTPAPPPKYIKDKTKYQGEKEQLEFAHPGGTAVAYYTVTRDGKVLFKQTFRSWYKPWAAVYKVGTKEKKKKVKGKKTVKPTPTPSPSPTP